MIARATHFRIVPLFETAGWAGDMDDGRGFVSGRCFSVAWLGFYVEIAFARETVR